MSTRCNIIIRNDNNLRREVWLYQHSEGHPNHILLTLTSELRDIYQEFSEHGDVSWFFDPCKLAGSIIVRSVPVMTEEMKKLLNTLPPSMKSNLESSLFLGNPTIIPDIGRSPNCNYEYIITLKDDPESGLVGYQLEAHKLVYNKRVSELYCNFESLIKSPPPKNKSVAIVKDNKEGKDQIAATKEEKK